MDDEWIRAAGGSAVSAEMMRRPGRALARPSPMQRTIGLGSVFGKTVRDSRRSVLLVVAVLGALIVAGGAAMSSTYGALETRAELAFMARTLPTILVGLYGDPRNVDTLGGFISWHYGAYFALLAGLWSILALSSTLAGEARRGSLELVASTPTARRMIAIEKVAGHVAAVVIAMTVLAVISAVAGQVFWTFEGDDIDLGTAGAFALGVALKALVAGSIAFAVAPILGQGAAAGLAGAWMLAGYLLNSYRSVVPLFDGLANFGWFAWTRDHVPLADSYDWAALGLLAVVAMVLIGVGIEAFARRDVGSTVAIRGPRLPGSVVGIRGPVGRTFAELQGRAVGWGLGLGIYGFAMAASSTAFIDALRQSPGVVEAFKAMMPGVDLSTAAGFLQFVFVDVGLLLAGLAAATFVATWASDEMSGRTELLLTTPLSRARFLLSGAIATCLAMLVSVGLVAIAVGFGVGATGGAVLGPVLGLAAVALYGAAIAGVGFAAGGLFSAGAAAPAAAATAIGTFLVHLLGPALKLPDWLQQLALSGHMGHPLIGSWDPVGLTACIALAVGGALLGAWGLRRRDVAG